MKTVRWAVVILLLSFLQLVINTLPVNGEIRVSDYDVQFELIPDASGKHRDLQTTLRITYDARQERISKGFKFVGNNSIIRVSVSDEQGDIPFTVKSLKEKKISFTFPPLRNAAKTVTVRFISLKAVQQGLWYNTIRLPWAGKWEIPVDKASFTFILPEGYHSSRITGNLPFTQQEENGGTVVRFSQEPLKESEVALELIPPVDNPYVIDFFIVALLVWAYLIAVIVVKNKRFPRTTVALDGRETTPAEIAHIKKDLKHSLCVSVFDLLLRGTLKKNPDKTIQATSDHSSLYPYELNIVQFFNRSRTIKDLIGHKQTRKSYEKEIQASLTRKGCYRDRAMLKLMGLALAGNVVLAVIVLILAGKAYAVGIAPVAISLIVPVLVFFFGIFLLLIRLLSPKALQACTHWELAIKNSKDTINRTEEGQYQQIIVYAVAILGFSILAGTIFESYLDAVSYARAMQAGSSSSCSSCSSGGGDTGGGDSGGGGGDGGGCGGCGGGGD